MPLPINEHAIDEMHQGFNMVDDSMRNVNTTMESVLDSLNELVRINTQSLESLVDMLKIDTESLEMARLQRAFDEEKQTEEDIVKPEITKEVKDNTDKNFAELMKNNAGLITGITSAVLGLMAMKDWIAEGFRKVLNIKTEEEKKQELNQQIKTLEQTQATEGLDASGQEELATLQAQQRAVESGQTVAQASGSAVDEIAGFSGSGEFALDDPETEKQFEEAQKAKVKRKQIGRMKEDFDEILRLEQQGHQDWFRLGGLWDDTYDREYQNEIDKKIERITSTATKYNIKLPTNIQNYIDQREERYEVDAGDASYMASTPEQDLDRSVPTPMNTIIESQSVTPPAGNYGISDSPSMKAFKASPAETKVNPSADSNVTMFVNDGSGYKDMNGKPIINNIDNSTNTTVVGGGSGGSSTGQYVGNATRTKSHQDAAASRNQ